MSNEPRQPKAEIPVFDYHLARYLVIDDVVSMRTSLRTTISTLGGTKIDMVGAALEALNRLAQHAYDIILCDYDLGGGKDGQQLLEEIKNRKLIRHSAIFIMVTAERGYEKVVSAVELSPDDYLIKPFAGEVLRLRIERAAQKKTYFSSILDYIDTENYRAAIEACDELLLTPSQYKIDLLRLKAETCLLLGDVATARSVYEQILAMREMPWARMGLAKTLYLNQEYEKAATMFEAVTHSNQHYMEAHDWLAKAHSAAGDDKSAQQVLTKAVDLSPRMVHRRKTLGETALRNGDLETAQLSFEAVLEFGQNSAFTRPEDFANLSRVLLEKNEPDKAMEVMKDARKFFKDSPEVLLHGAIMDCMALTKEGKQEEAEAALKASLEQFEAAAAKPESVVFDMSSACFLAGDADAGQNIIQAYIKNHHADKSVHRKAEAMFSRIGMADQGKAIVNESSREVVKLNNSAVRMAQAGNLKGAMELLMSAVEKYQDNTVIVLNAAHSVLAYMQANGWDEDLDKSVTRYLEIAKRRDPSNQKGMILADLYRDVALKFGIRQEIR